jgi:outer membrane protein assembly factor BamD
MKNRLIILVLVILYSCGGYQAIMKSDDLNFKFESAKKYYDEQEYFKALPLLDELHTLLRGTEKSEEIDYLLAYTHYGLESFTLASYHFASFTLKHPTSKYKEELAYMSAYCFYLDSPKFSLDKTSTVKAIQELQFFIDEYPESARIEECNKIIDQLTNKLQKKALSIAKLYYNIGDYKAAITSLNNVILDFPAIENIDEIQFLILDSNYKLAQNSVSSKTNERFNNTVASYLYFSSNYENSARMKDANSIYKKSIKQLESKQ